MRGCCCARGFHVLRRGLWHSRQSTRRRDRGHGRWRRRNTRSAVPEGCMAWAHPPAIGLARSWAYAPSVARTHKKVGYSPTGNLDDVTPEMAASGMEAAFRMLEGRWKIVIIFHLFDKSVLRFSELQRAIPGVSQKM